MRSLRMPTLKLGNVLALTLAVLIAVPAHSRGTNVDGEESPTDFWLWEWEFQRKKKQREGIKKPNQNQRQQPRQSGNRGAGNSEQPPRSAPAVAGAPTTRRPVQIDEEGGQPVIVDDTQQTNRPPARQQQTPRAGNQQAGNPPPTAPPTRPAGPTQPRRPVTLEEEAAATEPRRDGPVPPLPPTTTSPTVTAEPVRENVTTPAPVRASATTENEQTLEQYVGELERATANPTTNAPTNAPTAPPATEPAPPATVTEPPAAPAEPSVVVQSPAPVKNPNECPTSPTPRTGAEAAQRAAEELQRTISQVEQPPAAPAPAEPATPPRTERPASTGFDPFKANCATKKILAAAKSTVRNNWGDRRYSGGLCALGVRQALQKSRVGNPPITHGIGNAIDLKNSLKRYGYVPVKTTDLSKVPPGAIIVFSGPRSNEYFRTGRYGQSRKGDWLGHVTIKGDDGFYYTDGKTREPAVGWRNGKNHFNNRNVAAIMVPGPALVQQHGDSCR